MNSILDVKEIGMYDAGNTLGKLRIYELVGSRLRGRNDG